MKCTLHDAVFKNTSSPIDRAMKRTVYHGCAKIKEVLPFENGDNLRDYLYNGSGKRTNVQKDILGTLHESPHDFAIRNSGITAIARKCRIDDKNSCVTLEDPNIINGAQTQGVIQDFLDSLEDNDDAGDNIYVQIEIIVTEDDDLITETAISRNNQHKVEAYGIAARRGDFDDLVAIMSEAGHEFKTRQHEDNSLDNILQLVKVLVACTPMSLLNAIGIQGKSFAYDKKAKCLKLFERVYNGSNDKSDQMHDDYVELYNCWFDIAPHAWDAYLHWKSHEGFYGTRLQCIERDEYGQVVSVPDGLIFPIIAALSRFVKKVKGTYRFTYPEVIDNSMIRSIKSVYLARGSHPGEVGKDATSYAHMDDVVEMYREMSAAS